MEEIRKEYKEKGMPTDAINMYLLDCHNYLQNVWIGKMNKDLSKFLSEVTREDLDDMDSRWRVSTNFTMILIAADREFSLYYNYPKGVCEAFCKWMEMYHPGAFLLPVECGLGS